MFKKCPKSVVRWTWNLRPQSTLTGSTPLKISHWQLYVLWHHTLFWPFILFNSIVTDIRLSKIQNFNPGIYVKFIHELSNTNPTENGGYIWWSVSMVSVNRSSSIFEIVTSVNYYYFYWINIKKWEKNNKDFQIKSLKTPNKWKPVIFLLMWYMYYRMTKWRIKIRFKLV